MTAQLRPRTFQEERRSGQPVVAHVCDTFLRLSENWIDTQIRNNGRYDALVLSYYSANAELHSATCHPALEGPASVVLLNRAARKVTGLFPRHYLAARRAGAVLLHAHFGPEGYRSIALARVLARPLVVTFYGYDASRLPRTRPEWGLRYRQLFEEGALFLAEGPAMAGRLAALGCSPEKVRVHHLGIEVEEYPHCVRTREPGEPLRVLIAGRMTPKKGFPDAVEAVAAALRRGENLSITIIGDAGETAVEQAEKRRVLDLIKRHGIQDRVELLGMRSLSELRQAYYHHHVLLSPSHSAPDGDAEGGAPVTLIEAGATGMAVVSTRHDDIPAVVRDGETGLLADEGDVSTLTAHLLTLARDGAALERLGRSAADWIRQQYNARRQGERLADLYDEVIG